MNITKTTNGFILNNNVYEFQNFDIIDQPNIPYEIICDTQLHIGTNNGIILLDTSMMIDDQLFTDIQSFVDYLITN